MISRKLQEVIKLSEMRSYEIAHQAGIHPSTLSRILNGIETVETGDPRVIRIGRVVGVAPEACFKKNKKS